MHKSVIMVKEVQPEMVLCFLFVGLSIGSITTYCLSRYAQNIPYTVVLFIWGIVLSQATIQLDLALLGESIRDWQHIDPHLLLFVFLPALLFGEAMSLNIHHLKLTFFSALLLAGPGSVYGAMVLGALTKVIVPYGWGWGLCFTFGSILCATDPVAVVAVLKQVGATPRITMLVTQEALMNDGAALVLYNLFFSQLLVDVEESEKYSTVSSIATYFIKVIVISPLLGIAFGLATVYGFKRANNRMKHDDSIIQVSLTLCCAYLSFFVAEHVVGVSGVICCCAAGVVISWIGSPLIIQHETMHSVWSSFEWIGNTLIFLLAGLLFGSEVVYNVTGMDILMVFVVYILLHFIRGFMLFMFYPAISKGLYGLNVLECLFLTWGGLRGAVGMALALALLQNTRDELTTISLLNAHRAFFIVGGVAALTLIINATTAKAFLHWLGLIEETSDEIRTMQHYARKRIHRGILQLVLDLKEELPALDNQIVSEFHSTVKATSAALGQDPGTATHHRKVDRQRSSVNRLDLTSDDPVDVLKPYGHKPLQGRMFNYFQKKTDADEDARSVGSKVSNQSLNDVDAKVDGAESSGSDSSSVDGDIVDDPYAEDIIKINTFTMSSKNIRVNAGIGGYGRNSTKARMGGISESNVIERPKAQVTLTRIASFLPEFISPKPAPDPPPPVQQQRGKQRRVSLSMLSTAESDAAGANTGTTVSKSETTSPNRDRIVAERCNTSSAHLTSLLTHNLAGMMDINPVAQQKLGANRHEPNEKLLMHIRIAFLEVLRTAYWKHIEEGKLPRGSSAALLLIGSVDFGYDMAHKTGLQDWEYILPFLQSPSKILLFLAGWVDYFSYHVVNFLLSIGINYFPEPTELEDDVIEWHQGNCMYVLASMIEAHEYAQKTILYYLGEKDKVRVAIRCRNNVLHFIHFVYVIYGHVDCRYP